jgi:hypothetical protein
MDYTVELTITTDAPLAEDQFFEVASYGGAAAGDLGGHELSTTMTISSDDMPTAAAMAIAQVTAVAPGIPSSVEVMTTDEHDRRLAEPPFPELVGISEVAETLGVSRQRASELRGQPAFPAPVAVLRATPVWRRADLGRFLETWDRRPGRRAS